MKEFGVPTQKAFADSRANFQAFLAAEFKENRTVILMLDEAQGIRSPNFELIRSLLNFETDRQKLLNIILLGQNELARKLDQRPELKSRVTIFGALTSLSRDDMEKMARFRWQVAGGETLPFTPAALESVFRYSKGLPRMVCTVCNTALTKAFVRKTRKVDDAVVMQAAEELRLVERTPLKARPAARRHT
jgi:general secretion pathway protein A